MADSFCLIPSKADPSTPSLKDENAALKAELEKQRQQLANMEQALKVRQEQDLQLRDSIMIARKEVRFLLHYFFPDADTAVRSEGPPSDDLFQCATTIGAAVSDCRYRGSQHQCPAARTCPCCSAECGTRT